MEVDGAMPLLPKMNEEQENGRHDDEDGERPNAAGTTGSGENMYEEAEILADDRPCLDECGASRVPEAADAAAAAAAAGLIRDGDDDHDHGDDEAGSGEYMDRDALKREVMYGSNDVEDSLMERANIGEPGANADTMLEGPQEGGGGQRLKQLQVVRGFNRLLGGVDHHQQKKQQDTEPARPESALPEGRRGGLPLSAVQAPVGWSPPAPTASKPKGGAVGRKKGAAQHNRPVGSKPSKTGVSKLELKNGSIISVVECIADANCRGVWGVAKLVNQSLKGHLEKAHGYTREQLADPEILKFCQCSCPKCFELGDAGSNKLVDPKTFFEHLAKTGEPTPEENMCLDSSVSLAGISSKFASTAARIEEHGKPPLPPALGAELSLLWSEAVTVLTRVMINLGVQLPTEAPLLPVTLSFAIKRTMKGELQMVFACPGTCQDYQDNGLRVPRSYRDHHKAQCHPDKTSSFLRCIVSSGCKARFESMFTPEHLEHHMKEVHGGLEELCKPRETDRLDGRLSVLTKEVLDQIGDRWADPEHKNEMGSPYRNSKNNEVYFFSTQVFHGDGGGLVIETGYTLDSSAEARVSGGGKEAAGAAAAAGVASAPAPPAVASSSKKAEATAATTAASSGKNKKNKKKNKKKPDKVSAVGPTAAAVGSVPTSPQRGVNRQSQTTDSALAGDREQRTAAAGKEKPRIAVNPVCRSEAAPAASPVSNRRSSNEENALLRGGTAATGAAGVGRGASGGKGLLQSNRPHRQSKLRLPSSPRNGKSPGRANPPNGSPQVRARGSASLNRANAASPRRDGMRSPARGTTYHAALDCTGSDGGGALSPSPSSVPAVAATTAVDQTATSTTPDNMKRMREADSKSPPYAPPRKVQAQG